ncbi:DUF4340 domain-containing protein [Enterococcus sp. HY326]|uniref:DUF4340 domain-containing protein n=1 Tax=Enterococcus sp. HY326 TaxID=2971265 RepID=UPI0022402112|nr:DUF4340 domain-containing protein [Enterococcus sp. HY326]
MQKVYKNPYVILSGLLIIGMIIYIFLANYNEDVAAETAASSEAATIYVTDYADVTSFSYSDSSDTLSFEKMDDDWVDTSVPDVSLSTSTLEVTAQAIGQLTATKELTEDLDDLAAYGLAEPTYQIQFATEEAEGEILIGNTLSDGSYYAKLADSDTIYVIDSTLVSYLTFDVNTLVATPEVPALDSDTVISVSQITDGIYTELTAEDDQTETTESSTTEDSTTESSAETATTESTEAAATPFSDAVSYLTSLYISSSINYQPTDEELVSYGLSTDARTTYEVVYQADDEEKTFTMYIGNLDSETGYYYLQVPDNSVVYQLSQTTVENLLSAFSES